jgi:hypothetical protein
MCEVESLAFSSIYQFYLYCGSQFYWWRKTKHLWKIPHLLQVTDKFDRVHLTMGRGWVMVVNATSKNISWEGTKLKK